MAAGLPPVLGVTATGTVLEVTATRDTTASSASASVAGVTLGVLGAPVLASGTVTAAVSCPVTGRLTADTTLAGLLLFGTAVTLAPNGRGVTASAAVTMSEVADARLTVTVRRIETVGTPDARAVAVRAMITGGRLPATGSDLLGLIGLGVGLLLAGAVPAVTARHRKDVPA